MSWPDLRPYANNSIIAAKKRKCGGGLTFSTCLRTNHRPNAKRQTTKGKKSYHETSIGWLALISLSALMRIGLFDDLWYGKESLHLLKTIVFLKIWDRSACGLENFGRSAGTIFNMPISTEELMIFIDKTVIYFSFLWPSLSPSPLNHYKLGGLFWPKP